MGTQDVRQEWLKCKKSAAYFIHNYCRIYDATKGEWIPFSLWPRQIEVVKDYETHKWLVALKARQLGMTWLTLSFILWKMLFHPSFTALIFSRREVEAIYLLGEDRLRGIYKRLPEWMQARQILTSSSHVWQLSNGSVAYGFPTSAGDSYTASFAFVDEADLVPDLDRLMNAVKPTIDGGGQMVLLSRADKKRPGSLFKRTYIAARQGTNGWKAIFLPWHTRPDRTQEWYERQRADIFARTRAYDDLYQQYPATDEEALLPPTADRRIPFEWLRKCFVAKEPQPIEKNGIDVPFLQVYTPPQIMGEYFIGADPAEGNPTSDDSCASVVDMNTLEEVAVVAGKIEPSVFAGYLDTLSTWYNNATILPERNNHGHAVILALDETYGRDCAIGWDDRPGWMSSSRGKALMYSLVANSLKDGEPIIHTDVVLNQLASIEGGTLRAPEDEPDDYATAYSLAIAGIKTCAISVEMGVSPVDGHRG